MFIQCEHLGTKQIDCSLDGVMEGVNWREMKAEEPGEPQMMEQRVMAPINQDNSFTSW